MLRTSSCSRISWLLCCLIGAVSCAGFPDAARAKDGAAMPAKFAGAFVNWGADGREKMLQAWEQWLKRPGSSVLGLDFYAKETWNDYVELSWVPGVWARLNPERNVVWSVPLTVKDTPLADVAEGDHDAAFEAAAQAIARAQPKAAISWPLPESHQQRCAAGRRASELREVRL